MQDRNTFISVEIDGDYCKASMRLPTSSMISRYLMGISPEQPSVMRSGGSSSNGSSHKPRITVLVRTQGNRIDSLRETLLCLMSQTCEDFVVLVLLHNASQEGEDAVRSVISSYPSCFSSRISLIPVQGGDRSRPLNVGLGNIRTDYFTILDDDDIVFDNWIDAFLGGIDTEFGKIIHSMTFIQPWKRLVSGSDVALAACGSPDSEYCATFDPMQQLSDNMCPIMSLAFPTYVFTTFGITFDESLTTTEDWDFLMRSADICGVYETGECTSIYRLWQNANVSRKQHENKEWCANKLAIQERLCERPRLIPASCVERIIADNETDRFTRSWRPGSIELVVGTTDGPEINVHADYSFDPKYYANRLIAKMPKDLEISFIRLKPTESMFSTVEALRIKLIGEEQTRCYDEVDLSHGGVMLLNNAISFIGKPAELMLRLKSPFKTGTIDITYRCMESVPDLVLQGTKLRLRYHFVKMKVLRKLGLRPASEKIVYDEGL